MIKASDPDSSVHLSFLDIAVDNQEKASIVRITTKQCKSDPTKGTNLRSKNGLCGVSSSSAVTWLRDLRGSKQGPLLLYRDM